MSLFNQAGLGNNPLFLTGGYSDANTPNFLPYIDQYYKMKSATDEDARKKLGKSPELKTPDWKGLSGDLTVAEKKYNTAKNDFLEGVKEYGGVWDAYLNSDSGKAKASALANLPSQLAVLEQNQKRLNENQIIANKNPNQIALDPTNLFKPQFDESGKLLTNAGAITQYEAGNKVDKSGNLVERPFGIVEGDMGDVMQEFKSLYTTVGGTDWDKKSPILNPHTGDLLSETGDSKSGAYQFLMNQQNAGSSNVKQINQMARLLVDNLSEKSKAGLTRKYFQSIPEELMKKVESNPDKAEEILKDGFGLFVQEEVLKSKDPYYKTGSKSVTNIDLAGKITSGPKAEDLSLGLITGIVGGSVPANENKYQKVKTESVLNPKTGLYEDVYNYDMNSINTSQYFISRNQKGEETIQNVKVPMFTWNSPNLDNHLAPINKIIAERSNPEKGGTGVSLKNWSTGGYGTFNGVPVDLSSLPGAQLVEVNGIKTGLALNANGQQIGFDKTGKGIEHSFVVKVKMSKDEFDNMPLVWSEKGVLKKGTAKANPNNSVFGIDEVDELPSEYNGLVQEVGTPGSDSDYMYVTMEIPAKGMSSALMDYGYGTKNYNDLQTELNVIGAEGATNQRLMNQIPTVDIKKYVIPGKNK